MKIDLETLARDVGCDLEAYVVPELNPAALGTPLPAEWYANELAAMRASLVVPFWTKIRDIDPQTGHLVILDVAVVAEDGVGYLVAFDPLADGEYVLGWRQADPDAARGINAVSCGVRGDAVGCFLSR